jgi:DeoR/GlpR family transcriptional regulator of sugar metabolism
MSGRTIGLAVNASSPQRIAGRQSSNALEKRKIAAEAAGNYFHVYGHEF